MSLRSADCINLLCLEFTEFVTCYHIRFNFCGVKLSRFAIFQDVCILIFAVVGS